MAEEQGEKVQPPSQQKLDELRKDGNWFSSKDLTAGILFAAAALMYSQGSGAAADKALEMVTAAWRPEILAAPDPFRAIGDAAGIASRTALLIAGPFLAAMLCVSGLSMLLQVGPMFSTKKLSPDFSKLNPAEGLKRMFLEPKTWAMSALGIAKAAVMLAMLWSTGRSAVPQLIGSTRLGVRPTASLFHGIFSEFLWKAALVCIAFGVMDFLIQRATFMKQNWMTFEEAKEEAKENELPVEARMRIARLRQEMKNQRKRASQRG
jgi:flagellar biosynthesis protein FlhB